MNPDMMKAIVATGYGTSDVLTVQQVPVPTPATNEVLVRIYATTVTKADTMMRTGKPLFGRLMLGLTKPKNPIPGTGFAGVVEAVGKEVSLLQVGQRVFGETAVNFSANAEYVCLPENGVILPMPESMRYAEAALFTDGPMTSLNFLQEIGKLKPGQKVLINGASGSLGTAAIQLAKYMGAEVTGVCSTRNLGLVRSLGADQVVDYARQDFTQLGQRFHLIYDAVGKSSYRKCKQALQPEGKFLSPVLGGAIFRDMLFTSAFSSQKAQFAATGLKPADELRTLLSQLVEIWRQGHLKAVIDRQYPLDRVPEAHSYVDTGRKKGNVLISVREDG